MKEAIKSFVEGFAVGFGIFMGCALAGFFLIVPFIR